MAVAKGHGRAIAFLKKSGGDQYRDLILSLCFRAQEFDPWFEDRTDYMCRLVDTLHRPLELVPALGTALFRSRRKRDRRQVRYLLAHLYRAGSAEAREYLLNDFLRFRLRDRQFARAVEFLGLEGLELALGQAQRLEDWEIQESYREAIKQFGQGRTLELFERLAPSKVDLVLDRLPKPEPPKRERIIPSEWIQKLAAGEKLGERFAPPKATEDDWRALATLAMETSDSYILRRAASLLHMRPWPLDVKAALGKSDEERLSENRRYRFWMLESTASDILRAWGLAHLGRPARSRDFGPAMGLLSLNAKGADRPALAQALYESRSNREAFHSAGLDILWLKCGPTTEMLEIIYEHGYCDECRNHAIRRLVKRRAVTAAMREECVEDSDEDTRKWARKATLSPAPRGARSARSQPASTL